jgi:Terminase RNaseH-like domain
MNAHFYIGVDPGQAVDPTAIAVVQRIANANGKPTFRCGHLERLPLATPYPGVVQHVRRLVSKEPFLGHSELVLDLTGVGRPVADLFQAEGLRPVKVSITAGDSETLNDHGIWHVAKLLLVSTVQALLHDGRLQIQKDIPEAPVLKVELEDFRASVTDSGRWTFGARSGAHDDLVLALALALWRASRRAPMYVHPSVLARSALSPARLRTGYNSFDPPSHHEPYPWWVHQRRS